MIHSESFPEPFYSAIVAARRQAEREAKHARIVAAIAVAVAWGSIAWPWVRGWIS